RYFSELVDPGGSPAFKAEPGKFRSELHDRLSGPLYPIAFVLIALATVGRAQSTRQNRTQWMVAGFFAGAGTRLVGLAASNLVTSSAAAVPLLYAIPIGASVVSLAMIVAPGLRRGRMSSSRALARSPSAPGKA
ncbi:MAG: hypothetical protein SH859_10035, partial [Hyphomicrobium aestuarii]|nr:hypothetical protein [Hyphomicrobium aestuarii]